MTSYNSVETFCGAGGFLTGSKQAGFNTLLANDCWGKAIETIKLNYPSLPTIQKEIQNVTIDEILNISNLSVGELNHFHGSWPCQENSSANSKAVKEQNSNIARGFHWFIDKVEGLQPEIATGENVEGIIMSWKKKHFDEGLERILSLGNYEYKWLVLPCAYWGSNNWRPRMFIVLRRTDVAPKVELTFPSFSTEDLCSRTIKSVFPHLDGAYDLQYGGKEISQSHILPTMMATQNLLAYENGFKRKFTLNELKVIQTFPSEYKFPGYSYSDLYKLIGNAVPVETARMLMLHLKTTILDVHHANRNTLHDTKSWQTAA